ncbi:MAG: thioesterase family protein [Pirellulales bacterium]
MPAIFLHHHTVRPEEIDGLGHVNNVCYVSWMQDAAVAHSSAQGWTPDRYHAAGFGWVARSHSIEYRSPAFEGEPIVVKTWVADLQRVSSVRKFEIRRATDDVLLARAETNWAFVRFADQRIMRIPAEVADAFTVVPGGNRADEGA